MIAAQYYDGSRLLDAAILVAFVAPFCIYAWCTRNRK